MKQAAILVGSGIGAVIISALTVGAFAFTIPLAMAGNALAGRIR